MSDRSIIESIVPAVNATGTLVSTVAGVATSIEAKLDYLDATGPAASVQQLPDAKWAVQYVTGGGIRQTPFAVNLRTPDADTAMRVEAAAVLLELGAALEALGSGYTALDTPSKVVREDNGSEVWRASFMLESVSS